MKNTRKKVIFTAVAISVGLLTGFAYWRFVGCQSGSCGITANWHSSTLMGGLFGYLVIDSFKFEKSNTDSKTPQEK